MKSSLPEISSVAWSSFITGKNPGQHGIFGFMGVDWQNYEYRFPNFHSIKEKPFWEKEDIKTIAFNIPQTYPAIPLQGVKVSGFVALDLKKATYPERVFHYLNKIGYKTDVDSQKATESPEMFFTDLFETFAKRKQAIEYLYENEDWQLFIGIITETDRLHHFFFDSAKEGKYFSVFERFYTELDAFLDVMAKKEIFYGAYAGMGPDLYLLPNHGFDLKASAGTNAVFGLKQFRGMHTYDDAHLFVSHPVKNKAGHISIEHISDIIVDYLQIVS